MQRPRGQTESTQASMKELQYCRTACGQIQKGRTREEADGENRWYIPKGLAKPRAFQPSAVCWERLSWEVSKHSQPDQGRKAHCHPFPQIWAWGPAICASTSPSRWFRCMLTFENC